MITLLQCRNATPGLGEMFLRGSLEDNVDNFPGGLRRPTALRGMLQRLLEATHDKSLEGILIHLGPLEGGFARVAEVGNALQRLGQEGRFVHCHLGQASNLTYWLAASACDDIALSPAGGLELTGLAMESYYFRELLDRLGIEVDVLREGTHKGALEFATRTAMSPEQRETMAAILDDLEDLLISGIAQGREMEPAMVRDLMDRGPLAATVALDMGLVDRLAYPEEALEHLRQTCPGELEILPAYSKKGTPGEGETLLRLTTASDWRPQPVPRVAVLYLSGPIVDDGGSGGFWGQRITPALVMEAIEAVRDDSRIRAVVVRIESPGGSAAASDRMWHELLQLRSELPLVASLGDVAASGGYYVAAATSEIVAQPGTLTGSIGVIGGKLVLAELADRAGVGSTLLRRGRNAGLNSPVRNFTVSQRRALEGYMGTVYERFIESIVVGRAMSEDQVRRLATGQVWTGRRALDLGLIDRLGGLHEAIALARELGGLDEKAPVEAFPRPKGFLEQVELALDPMARAQAAVRVAGNGLPLDLAALLSRERVFTFWLPPQFH
jgi:protease-4